MVLSKIKSRFCYFVVFHSWIKSIKIIRALVFFFFLSTKILLLTVISLRSRLYCIMLFLPNINSNKSISRYEGFMRNMFTSVNNYHRETDIARTPCVSVQADVASQNIWIILIITNDRLIDPLVKIDRTMLADSCVRVFGVCWFI